MLWVRDYKLVYIKTDLKNTAAKDEGVTKALRTNRPGNIFSTEYPVNAL
jgi:hypothetical protein